MVPEKAFAPVVPSVSVAVKVKLTAPEAAVVPEITPVPEAKVMPLGRAPAVIE